MVTLLQTLPKHLSFVLFSKYGSLNINGVDPSTSQNVSLYLDTNDSSIYVFSGTASHTPLKINDSLFTSS